MQKVVLVITDGIGYKEKKEYNAFHLAKKPTYDYLFKNIPNSLITTHGEEVGLPAGVMGNSEVGHLNIGSGRIFYQDLVKINNSIKNNTLKDNEILNTALDISENIHLAILLSDGGVHAHINHLFSVIEIAENKTKITPKNIFLHLITDGRDVQPETALNYLNDTIRFIKKYKNTKIATISGRFFAMDRDNRWERTEQFFKALNGEFKSDLSPLQYLENSFKENIFDEFINPASFNFDGIKDGDSFIFLNYRSDRARQITKALYLEDFNNFQRQYKKIYITCMCEYDESLNLPVIFSKDKIQNTLSQTISRANLKQAHIAETEKYAHVTFFFNGGREEPFLNEARFLIPSPKVKTYNLQPEMSAKEVGDKTVECMKNGFDFIVVNFANGDMVGHTGDLAACIKAVEAVDSELQKIIATSKITNHALIITSDHGNCEEMKDENLKPLTNHTVGDVFCFIKAENVKNVKNGRLSNIAPTVLKIMNLETPEEMDQPLF